MLNPPTVVTDPIPHPKGLYGAALGIALVPLIFAVLVAGCGGCVLARKQQLRSRGAGGNERQQHHEMFKPSILKLPWLVVLMGFVVTAIALVELSCHILPPTFSSVQVSNLTITKVFVSDTVIRRDVASLTLSNLPALTCSMSGTYSVSLATFRDSGTSTTVASTFGTTVCSISKSAVVLPTCIEPPTAPAPTNWLGAQEVSNSTTVDGPLDGAFFLANMFPTLVATLFAIPWKIMHLHATSLEPWHQMARPGGALFSRAILDNYTGKNAFRAPLTALSTCLVYSSAVITALASEAWGLGLVGSCAENSSHGCSAIVQVSPQVVHIIQAFLGLVGLLIICLAVVLRKWQLGVWADPRNTLGIASLVGGGWVLNILGLFDLSVSVKELKERLGKMTVRLDNEIGPDGTTYYGMVIAGNMHDVGRPEKTNRPGRMSMWRLSAMIGGLTALLLGLNALIIYYIITDYDTAFEHFMSGQGFGPRFLFSICGAVINLAWLSIFKDVLLIAPYYSVEPSKANTFYTSPYATDNYTALYRGIKRMSPLLVLSAIPTVLSDFLSLLLATVPFNRTTTWNAHWICSWVAVGQLSFMTLSSVLLIAFLLAGRPEGHINVSLLRKAPIAATLVALAMSGQGIGNVGEEDFREQEQYGLPKSSQEPKQQIVEYIG